MKKIFYLYIVLFTLLSATNECAYFINEIGKYKNNIYTTSITNTGLESTENLIVEYQYNLKRNILKNNLTHYLNNLILINGEKYQDISPLCSGLKRLSQVKNAKEAFSIKNNFFKGILFEFHRFYYQDKKKLKYIYINGCESYANLTSKLIFKYYKNYDSWSIQRIQKSINKYNKCKFFEYQNILNRKRFR